LDYLRRTTHQEEFVEDGSAKGGATEAVRHSCEKRDELVKNGVLVNYVVGTIC